MNLIQGAYPIIFTILFLYPCPSVWAKGTNTVILAIGTNKSVDSKLPPLKYAEQDVDRFVEAMKTVGQVESSQIFSSKSPSKSQYLRLLNRSISAVDTIQKSSKEARFLFYFSGHSDHRGLHLNDGFITRDEIQALLRQHSASTRILFLDGCFASGLTAKGVTKLSDTPMSLPEDPLGAVAITASSADEAAFESRALRGSVFTHGLLEGLYGKADSNQDGLVTINELYQHLYRTAKLDGGVSSPRQHPQLFAELSGEGALIISYPETTNHPVDIAENISGDLTLASKRGLRFFTYAKSASGVLRISVPEGIYDIRLTQGERIAEGVVSVSAGKTAEINAKQLTWRDKSITQPKGRYDNSHWRLGVGSESGYFESSANSVLGEIGFSSELDRWNFLELRASFLGNFARGRQWIDGNDISSTTTIFQIGSGLELSWIMQSFQPFSQLQWMPTYITQRWQYEGRGDRDYGGLGQGVAVEIGSMFSGLKSAGIDWGVSYRRSYLFIGDKSAANAKKASNLFKFFLVL